MLWVVANYTGLQQRGAKKIEIGLYWLTLFHIVEHTEADFESKSNQTNTEWKLNEETFHSIDPGAVAIDAFTEDWEKLKFYVFCILHTLVSVSRCVFKVHWGNFLKIFTGVFL